LVGLSQGQFKARPLDLCPRESQRYKEDSMLIRKLLFSGLCAVALSATAAAPPLAGEVTGNGKPTAAPTHANSICAFSGQNDFEPPDEVGRTAEHVQSWGQIDKETRAFLTSIGVSPGEACRANVEE
jgi:hypothetical protein